MTHRHGVEPQSRRPGRYLKTFLEPVASLSFNMGPWRDMGTTFVPEMTHFEVDPNKEKTSFLLVNLENWAWAEFSIFFGPSHNIFKNRGRKWKFQAEIYILPLVALQII